MCWNPQVCRRWRWWREGAPPPIRRVVGVGHRSRICSPSGDAARGLGRRRRAAAVREHGGLKRRGRNPQVRFRIYRQIRINRQIRIQLEIAKNSDRIAGGFKLWMQKLDLRPVNI